MHREKMDQMVSLKKTVTAIKTLYKNSKTIACSPDGDTDFFNIVTGIFQIDTLAPFLLIIFLDYVL